MHTRCACLFHFAVEPAFPEVSDMFRILALLTMLIAALIGHLRRPRAS